MSIWNGSITADNIIAPEHSEMVERLNVALDTANASQIMSPAKDLQFMSNMVRDIEGTEGTYEIYESFQAFFQDEGSYMNYEEFEEEYKYWSFSRKGYGIKNGSYDKKTFKNAKERGIDLDAVIEKRTMEILKTYTNLYKPYIIFETLMTVPADGAGVDYPFGKVFGAIRNYKIKERKLTNYDSTASAGELGSPVRNNWRTIKANTGISLEDINFYKQYMGDIEGIDEENLVVFGTSGAISQLKNLYSDFSPTTEEIISNGVPTGIQGWSVDGLTLVVVKTPFPKDTLAIVNPDAPFLISRLISPVPEFNGVAIEFPNDGEKFVTNAKSFQGANVVIQDEGYHMTGILDVLWVDIDTSNADATRIMKTAGFNKIAAKKADLRNRWYKSVNEKV